MAADAPDGPDHGSGINDLLGPRWVRTIRAAVRLTLYLLFTAALIPVQALALWVKSPLRERIPPFYHRCCCRLWGLHVEVKGGLAADRPLLLVSNHTSYLDIPVLSTIGGVSFIAKSEVAKWPFFGLLAKLQRTVFVDRRRSSTARQRDAIGDRLASGSRLILFAEGTSSDGNRVLPFKSALFSVAERSADEEPLMLQPLSIAFTHLNGIPIGHALRPFYAWYGDMDLAGHLWTFAGLGQTRVEVRLMNPVRADAFASRRELSRYMFHEVQNAVAASLTGRESGLTEPKPALGSAATAAGAAAS
ncbi:MAG: 1-acyl-sn-glycerol-3-phosphate acyltransferase [Alphaproteobacteria bacterium]|nr:1-acyl-sn-glycerol-3-phosphate acyltransferase [Alphaproteobacteria bacterium]MCB9931098.1 1-acyl-sn-glycerol-3-phosphate acyltransferase [Alphaproteobacteria bacterium]